MNLDLILPDQDLTPGLQSFARKIRKFCQDKIAPHARRIDEERVFRREMIAELSAGGILGGPIAKIHGGRGWTPLRLAIAHEEIGAVCGNTRGFLAVHTGLVSQCIEDNGSDAQKARWLPLLTAGDLVGCFGLTEENAGSDVASMETTATRTSDGWELRGRKIWITNGGIADLALVFANADPSKGRDGITGFLVELPHDNLRREPMPGQELGHRGSDHCQLVLDGVHVPAHAVVGEVGKGLRVAMRGLSAGRLSVAAGAVGIHRAALQASAEFANQRRQFDQPIGSFQMVQERLADMLVELLASRALVHRCATRRAKSTETPADIAAAKLYATEAAARAAEQAVLLHGGRGYSTEYPVERLWRDSMGLRIYEGTSLIQKTILARAVLKER